MLSASASCCPPFASTGQLSNRSATESPSESAGGAEHECVGIGIPLLARPGIESPQLLARETRYQNMVPAGGVSVSVAGGPAIGETRHAWLYDHGSPGRADPRWTL